MTDNFRVRLVPCVLAFILSMGWAATSRAQGFISPLIGFNFGGDANCPNITGCEEKRLNFGVSLGKMGSVFGFEEEFAYAKDFFGSAPTLNSSVLTVMSNVMFVPRYRTDPPLRPRRRRSHQDPRRADADQRADDRQQQLRVGHRRRRDHRGGTCGRPRRHPLFPFVPEPVDRGLCADQQSIELRSRQRGAHADVLKW